MLIILGFIVIIWELLLRIGLLELATQPADGTDFTLTRMLYSAMSGHGLGIFGWKPVKRRMTPIIPRGLFPTASHSWQSVSKHMKSSDIGWYSHSTAHYRSVQTSLSG